MKDCLKDIPEEWMGVGWKGGRGKGGLEGEKTGIAM